MPTVKKSSDEEIGGRLRWIRKQMDWTQLEMMNLLGLQGMGYVSKLETGAHQLSEDIINRLCKKLGVDRDWLLTGAGTEPVLNQDGENAGQTKLIMDRGVFGRKQNQNSDPDEVRTDGASAYRLMDVIQVMLAPENGKAANAIAQALNVPLAEAWAIVVKQKARKGVQA